ncbi:MAG: helix-turn-helix transcriptional regulator [Lutibacter sp.]
MVNTEEFAKRLTQMLNFFNLTASQFADQIKVQRSSISHILSGRNKPSLEFVMKVVKTFPEVELYWLLNGKGSFPSLKTESTISQTDLSLPKEEKRENLKSNSNLKNDLSKEITGQSKSNNIERIVIFFSDGSFKSYE